MTLNKYQRSPLEYKRVTGIIRGGEFGGMSRIEIARFFLGLDAGNYLRAIGGDPSRKREGTIAGLIFDKFVANEIPEEPILPELVPEPIPEKPQIPSGNECDGCSELDKILPKNRRWFKADRGEEITASIDMTDAPKIDGITQAELKKRIIATCNQWSGVENVSIKIKWLSSGKGDIHLEFKYIDGPGKILGATWVSREGTDMGVGSDLIGDIQIDNSDRWQFQGIIRLLQTVRHEFGHALGCGHFEDWLDLMNPSPTPYNLIGLGKQSITWLQETYPLQVAA